MTHDDEKRELDGWNENKVQKLVYFVVVVLAVVEEEVVEVENPRRIFLFHL